MNYSPFEANALHALRGAADDPVVLEEAEAMFMRGASRDPYAAERAALDRCAVAPVFAVMGFAATKGLSDQRPELWRQDAPGELWAFMRERCYRRHFPGN